MRNIFRRLYFGFANPFLLLPLCGCILIFSSCSTTEKSGQSGNLHEVFIVTLSLPGTDAATLEDSVIPVLKDSLSSCRTVENVSAAFSDSMAQFRVYKTSDSERKEALQEIRNAVYSSVRRLKVRAHVIGIHPAAERLPGTSSGHREG